MHITRIDHVAIAVPDIDEALGFFRDALGLEVTHTDLEEGQGVVVAFMPVGASEIELIEPVEAESGVARYLQKRGPGMHHICIEVDDLDAALARLQAREVRLIDEQPYIGTGGRRIAFIHPRSAYGVLVELYETLPGDQAGRHRTSLDELRRRLFAKSRVAAAGTRGFLDGLRRKGHGSGPGGIQLDA
jgi:methylmalonyl-CoA/ethylmalonyl-CoA epimerase